MNDSDFQALSTAHSSAMPKPVTITAAATVAPTGFLSVISGTTAVTTITPPITAMHTLAFRFATTNFGGFATTGNIAGASLTNATFWQNKTVLMVYDPLTAKYYPNYPGPVAATNV